MSASLAKIVRFDEDGEPGVLKLETIQLPEPEKDEVRLRIEAMSLNRADALFRANKYVIRPTLPGSRIGTDAAGIVEAVGSDVSGLKVGDRVIAGLGFDMSKYGTHGETAILPARFVHRYPDFLSPAEAASINNPFVTAWGALIDQGKMRAGDHVLITAASSSIGVAAIQLARAEGAIPIAVTRTENKRRTLLEIGAAHVIVKENEEVGTRVQEITGGSGARLIFDAVGGDTLRELGQIAAVGAIVFLYGAFDLGAPSVPMIPAITKEIRLWGYMVYSVHNSAERLARAFKFIYETLSRTGIRPVIDKVFSLSEYAEAHRYLESNEQVGRVVVTV